MCLKNLKEMRERAVVREEQVQTPGASRNTSGEFKERVKPMWLEGIERRRGLVREAVSGRPRRAL